MGLSALGIFHTVIGIAAIIAAVVSFVKFGRIYLGSLSGRIYFYGTLITSLTALGISKHGDFNPGHAFSILIVVLIILAFYLHRKMQNSPKARYFENFLLSFSLMLSMIPTVNETLTRVPLGHPLAKGPTDPIVGKTLLVFFVFFLAGSIYQFYAQRKNNRNIVR